MIWSAANGRHTERELEWEKAVLRRMPPFFDGQRYVRSDISMAL
jgi:hypothetical protein